MTSTAYAVGTFAPAGATGAALALEVALGNGAALGEAEDDGLDDDERDGAPEDDAVDDGLADGDDIDGERDALGASVVVGDGGRVGDGRAVGDGSEVDEGEGEGDGVVSARARVAEGPHRSARTITTDARGLTGQTQSAWERQDTGCPLVRRPDAR